MWHTVIVDIYTEREGDVRFITFRKFTEGHSEQRASTDGVICAHC